MTQIKDKTIQLTSAELEQLLEQRRAEEREAERKKIEAEKAAERQRRDAYEGIKAGVVHAVMSKVEQVTNDVEALHEFVKNETEAFKEVMREYGQLRFDNQMSYRIQEGNLRIEVKGNKVKRFDERADIAAARLIEFMRTWIETAPGGHDNPMYQLAMVLLERNKEGELDYKNISQLYSLEAQFDEPEYSEIMQLFKESHLVEGNAIRYYFWRKDDLGVWRKIEPSFNRM